MEIKGEDTPSDTERKSGNGVAPAEGHIPLDPINTIRHLADRAAQVSDILHDPNRSLAPRERFDLCGELVEQHTKLLTTPATDVDGIETKLRWIGGQVMSINQLEAPEETIPMLVADVKEQIADLKLCLWLWASSDERIITVGVEDGWEVQVLGTDLTTIGRRIRIPVASDGLPDFSSANWPQIRADLIELRAPH